MRFLFLLLAPLMGYSQSDTIVTFRVKEIHNITLYADTTIKWTIDTIKYNVPFEIKFTKKKISVDGYSAFTISKFEMRSHGDGSKYRWYLFSNGAYLMWTLSAVIIEYPAVKRKSKMLVFNIE